MIVPSNEPMPHHDASDTPRVRLSISEINALCFRAARGAGLAWGEAEEAGWAASRLAQAGLAGPAITLAWLGDLAALARPAPAPGVWPAMSGLQCPVRCGIALSDFAGLPEGPGARALTVERMAHPIMALPFVAAAARRTGLALRVRWSNADITLNGAAGPVAEELAGATGGAAADLRIEPTDRREPPCPAADRAAPVRAIAVADKRALDALALRITVPASEGSRAGAGAATGDND